VANNYRDSLGDLIARVIETLEALPSASSPALERDSVGETMLALGREIRALTPPPEDRELHAKVSEAVAEMDVVSEHYKHSAVVTAREDWEAIIFNSRHHVAEASRLFGEAGRLLRR
jgi:hypothetical protein